MYYFYRYCLGISSWSIEKVMNIVLSVLSRLLELQQQHERETGEMARYAPSCFASWMAIDPIPAAPQ
jgi:hypothetical protein